MNTENYFHPGRMDDVLPKEVMMTTSHQYEEAYIQLMTMRTIEVVHTKSNERLFLLSI